MRPNGVTGLYAGLRVCIGISLAILRRFWAVAARMNSSRAPFGPLSRKRSSLRMRLRCANSISIFLRSRREVRPSHDPAIWRTMSFVAFDAFLPIGIGLDQARIDGKPFPTDKPLLDAAAQNALEHATEQ